MTQIDLRAVTPAQIIATVGAVIAVAVSFGVDITQQQQDALLNLTGIVAAFLLGADAVIRHGRSKIAAAAVANGTASLAAEKKG